MKRATEASPHKVKLPGPQGCFKKERLSRRSARVSHSSRDELKLRLRTTPQQELQPGQYASGKEALLLAYTPQNEVPQFTEFAIQEMLTPQKREIEEHGVSPPCCAPALNVHLRRIIPRRGPVGGGRKIVHVAEKCHRLPNLLSQDVFPAGHGGPPNAAPGCKKF
jgi:hypothetical protein